MQGRAAIGRQNAASQARLQFVLLLAAAWNVLSFALILLNTRLLRVGDLDGALGARPLSGSHLVLALAYGFAARNPLRYRFVLWLATVEQFIAIFATAFHWARGDAGFVESAAPVAVSALLLVLLLTNLPRQADTIGA